jgi:hypothetical protein
MDRRDEQRRDDRRIEHERAERIERLERFVSPFPTSALQLEVWMRLMTER